MVDAAEAALLVAAEEQGRAAVRAVRVDDADVALGVLKAMSFSPKTSSLTGVLSALGTSSANITGSQKRRNSSPMGVPGPDLRDQLIVFPSEHPFVLLAGLAPGARVCVHLGIMQSLAICANVGNGEGGWAYPRARHLGNPLNAISKDPCPHVIWSLLVRPHAKQVGSQGYLCPSLSSSVETPALCLGQDHIPICGVTYGDVVIPGNAQGGKRANERSSVVMV